MDTNTKPVFTAPIPWLMIAIFALVIGFTIGFNTNEYAHGVCEHGTVPIVQYKDTRPYLVCGCPPSKP